MSKYTKDILEPVIARHKTWAAVCKELGVKPMTGAQGYIKSVAVRLGINFSHFTGRAWSRGRKDLLKKPLANYLCKGGQFITSHNLKLRLWREEIKPKHCEVPGCGVNTWLGNDIPLEIDHINGDHFDNRIENLMIVCPNCHAIKTRHTRGATATHHA